MLIKKQGQVTKKIMHLLTMVIVCLVFTGNSTAAAASVCENVRLSVKQNEEEPPQPQIIKSSEAILNQAVQDLLSGNYEKALEQFEKLGNHLDAEKYAVYVRARIKERDGFRDEAIELYRKLDGFLDSTLRIAQIQDTGAGAETASETEMASETETASEPENVTAEKPETASETEMASETETAEEPENVTAEEPETASETELQAGDHIFFGHYEQDGDTSNGKEEIEWRVLEVREDSVLVISEYGLDVKPYNTGYADVNWETCSLRKWLNEDFFTEAFTVEEQERTRLTKVENKDNSEYGTGVKYGITGRYDTEEKVFLLSIEEAEEYFTDNDSRIACATQYALDNGAFVYKGASGWWLRSPGYGSGIASYVNRSGSVDTYGNYVFYEAAVTRPAMWIHMESVQDSSDNGGDIVPGSDQRSALSDVQTGDHIFFGHYEQDGDMSNGKEEIEWRVLEVREDSVLVISEYGLDAKPYNSTFEKATWETCSLRKWLNGDFLTAAFTEEEQEQIILTRVENKENPEYGTSGGNDTEEKVFLLSIEEAEKYFADDESRIAYVTKYAVDNGGDEDKGAGWWWLRSPGYNFEYSTYVDSDGSVLYFGFFVRFSDEVVRPAMRINPGL